MRELTGWRRTAAQLRTIWFLVAMIPLVLITFLLGLLSLVVASPLTIYAGIRGKHLKDPWQHR
jgi:hypothetical protein